VGAHASTSDQGNSLADEQHEAGASAVIQRNDYNPIGLSLETREAHQVIFRQADILKEMPLPLLRGLWDQYDGCNAPEGFDGEAIHLALNMAGDGQYCSV
jgi:hypothetical protein